MKYAIYMPAAGDHADPRALADLAREAEAAGWDGFFLWDHITMGWTDRATDPWIALAAIASSTSRIRIGTTVTPLPRRRPWKVARETVALDHLSGGRFILGVGTGGGKEEWDNLGEQSDPAARGAMLDEALEVLTRLWSGEAANFEGRYYQVRDACFRPTPLQSPRIPIWVGGFWPNRRPFRRAARWDGVFPLFNVERERVLAQFKEAVAYVRACREDDASFDIISVGYTSKDHAQAAETVAPYTEAGATWWLECLDPWRFGWNAQGVWPAAAIRERVSQGPPR